MPACHRWAKAARTKQDQASTVGAGGLCRACASCGTRRGHVAAQPSSGPAASPLTVIFAPLASPLGEVSGAFSALRLLEAGAPGQRRGWWESNPTFPAPRVFLPCLTPVQKLLIILNYLLVL